MTDHTPYAAHAFAYRRAGWQGVLPIPTPPAGTPPGKGPPVSGYTGAKHDDVWPSAADIQTWIDFNPERGNISLRMPRRVLGIDVDAYDGKAGAATLAKWEAQWGELPPTIMSTSRGDGSGIRLFRVPERPSWRGEEGGIELIWHGHRYVIVWPSLHAEGRVYQWVDLRTGEILDQHPTIDDLADLPEAWVDGLSSDTDPVVGEDVDWDQAKEYIAAFPDGDMCKWVVRIVGAAAVKFNTGSGRHPTAAAAVMELVRAGHRQHPGVDEALSAVGGMFTQLATKPGERQRTSRQATHEWREIISSAVGKVKADPTPEKDCGCYCGGGPRLVDPPTNDSHNPGTASDKLRALLDFYRGYVHLPDRAPETPDTDHIVATLATAITREAPGDPLWLQLVGVPSSSKTETVRLLDDTADDRLDEVLGPAALLRWISTGTGKNKTLKPGGMLANRSGEALLATIADFSTILALSDRGSRDQFFAALRRVYDGNYSRDLGNGPRPLEWHGRLTLVSAVTPALDEYSAHADMLGPRWVNYRMPAPTKQARRKAAKAMRKGQPEIAENRRKAAELAADAITTATAQWSTVALSEELGEYIDACAIVCAQGRGTVPRESYGRRDVKGLPVIEEPPRLVGQLTLLAKGVLALGGTGDTAKRIVRRVALGSMPPERLQVLDSLAARTTVTASEASRRAGMHRWVAKRVLEDLDVLGVASCDADWEQRDADDSARTRPINYILDGPDTKLIKGVITGNEQLIAAAATEG